MKKTFAVIVLFAVAGALFWWLGQSDPESPAKVAVMTTQSKVAETEVALKSTSPSPITAVETPKVAAAPLAPNADARDPQENLDAAITDVARLVQANDFMTLFANYGVPIVDPTLRTRQGGNIRDGMQQNVQYFQAYMQSPEGQANVQKVQAMLAYIKTQTPVYNTAGDRATLQVGPMTDQLRAENLFPEITFIKKDGRWYLQAGNPFGW